MSTRPVSCIVISNRAISWSTKTATWRFAILVWPGFKTRRWPAMCRRDTIAPRRLCLHGKSMMWRSTSGVQGVFLPRCSTGSRCSLARTMSTNSPLSPNYWVRRQTTWSRPSAVKTYATDFLFFSPDSADLSLFQTLRFVKSLPKRERQPLTNRFKNADPEGT